MSLFVGSGTPTLFFKKTTVCYNRGEYECCLKVLNAKLWLFGDGVHDYSIAPDQNILDSDFGSREAAKARCNSLATC